LPDWCGYNLKFVETIHRCGSSGHGSGIARQNGMDFTGINGDGQFKPTNDGCQILRLWSEFICGFADNDYRMKMIGHRHLFAHR